MLLGARLRVALEPQPVVLHQSGDAPLLHVAAGAEQSPRPALSELCRV